MDIDRCNSIFELFAAFNFTYAILSLPNGKLENGSSDSQHSSFADMVDYHLVKPFSSLNLSLRRYEDKIASFKESLEVRKSLASGKNDTSVVQKCDELLKELDHAEDNVKVCKDLATEKKDEAKVKVDNKFPQISFLIALFCVSVLCLSTSEAIHKHFTLFMIDFWVFLTYRKYVMYKVFIDPDTYLKIIKFYVIGMFACIFIHLLIGLPLVQNYQEFKPIHEFLNNPTDLRKLFVLGNLMIPFTHFAYYFYNFYQQTDKIKKDSVVQFQLIDKKILEVDTELSKMPLN